MYVAENWKDYELLDTSDGERLERWGKYILIRPDPQVIWNGKREHKLWNKADGIYRRSNKGGGAWIKNDVPEKWTINYGDLTFNLKQKKDEFSLPMPVTFQWRNAESAFLVLSCDDKFSDYVTYSGVGEVEVYNLLF